MLDLDQLTTGSYVLANGKVAEVLQIDEGNDYVHIELQVLELDHNWHPKHSDDCTTTYADLDDLDPLTHPTHFLIAGAAKIAKQRDELEDRLRHIKGTIDQIAKAAMMVGLP